MKSISIPRFIISAALFAGFIFSVPAPAYALGNHSSSAVSYVSKDDNCKNNVKDDKCKKKTKKARRSDDKKGHREKHQEKHQEHETETETHNDDNH